MKTASRVAVTVALVMTLFFMFLVPVSAEGDVTVPAAETEALTLPQSYSDLADALPDDLISLCPNGLFSESANEAMDAVGEMTGWRYFLRALLRALGLEWEGTVGLLLSLIGLLLLAAIFSRAQAALVGSSVGDLCGFCLRLCLYVAIASQTAGLVLEVETFMTRLARLAEGMLPTMGVLYALGGNIGQAAVNEELLLLFLALCTAMASYLTPPLCGLCMAASLSEALGTQLSLSAIADRAKRWYTGALGLVMFLLSLSLSMQSVLVSRADTLGMRGVKYVVGNLVPIVGGALAGTLGTVSAGISLLRGVSGTAGVVLTLLLLLPTLVRLLLGRSILHIAETVATLLGCGGEAKLLGEMASLYGYLAAASCLVSVVFLLALGIFIHGGVAVLG